MGIEIEIENEIEKENRIGRFVSQLLESRLTYPSSACLLSFREGASIFGEGGALFETRQ